MDNNNLNSNEDDKYTNYKYQGSDSQYHSNAPKYQGSSEPDTYREPNSYQAPQQNYAGQESNGGDASNRTYEYGNNTQSNYSGSGNGYQGQQGNFNNGYQGQPNNFNNNYQGQQGNFNNNYQGQPNNFNNNYQGQQGNFNNGYQNQPYTYNYTGGYNTPVSQTNGLSIGSLICGVAGIVLSCWCIGIIPAIIAIVLSSKYKSGNNGKHCGQSTGGLICGIIGIVISVLAIAYYIIIIMIAAGTFGEIMSSSIYYNW